jgi:hypothetical protein
MLNITWDGNDATIPGTMLKCPRVDQLIKKSLTALERSSERKYINRRCRKPTFHGSNTPGGAGHTG